ncbi:MAG TPA: hypothetical protein VJM32_05780 [Candidatus Saccharimonadales bacterium]|nr:hypothetical protein [Candidatus Saccharimonadales bacterium]
MLGDRRRGTIAPGWSDVRAGQERSAHGDRRCDELCDVSGKVRGYLGPSLAPNAKLNTRGTAGHIIRRRRE